MLSSIISGNSAPGSAGGGLGSVGDSATMTVVGSSIVSANTGGDIVFTDGPTNSFTSQGRKLRGGGRE